LAAFKSRENCLQPSVAALAIRFLAASDVLNGSEGVDAPPQINPFAIAARESAREKQTDLL